MGRKHVHPPLNTDLANVPTGDQNLAYTNSRAMMDLDSLGAGFRAGVPVLPVKGGDAVKEVDRRLTPNSRSKKVEKDDQKRIRGLM